jgi:dTDP-glucose 4,6-dehydratase
MDTIIVTGGTGFIGSNFVVDSVTETGATVVNLDKLTYAGNFNNLSILRDNPRHIFVKGDIGDRELVRQLLNKHRSRAVVNFAAESHVDRSILAPGDFIDTNLTGTFRLL